ncbi:Signal transduction histidine kinase [Thermomonospora echinospora]|uniref:histidine kinase n=1 Tax=Thermomonospora echinospora TaxID=1992 RepID=A0A1H6DUV0_9ACTN|nr:sensor histidine kinase [Thermomonospora echinospora]SEG89162.1 Signal transduction histidine kinase [Thermomonospora echinospora]
MSEYPTDRHPRRAGFSDAALRQAVLDAAVRAPNEPPRVLMPGRRWVRWLELLLVTAMAVGFTGGTIAIPLNIFDPRPPAMLAVVLALMQAAPLAFAPRWPLAAWRISALGLLAGALLLREDYFWPWPVTSWLAFVVILFFTAVGYDRPVAVGAGLVSVGGLIVPGVVVAGMPDWFGLILAGIVVLVLAFGDAVGGRYTAELSLAEQEALRRQDLARQARLEERARIARELHDVVAHHMSVIAMQAEAAPYKIPDLPDAARDTFALVRDAARDALTETRRVVGLLRSEDEGAERRPQPGLERLEELVSGARRAGLSVDAAIVGVPRPVSAGVDLSAYRIVQESLSNASRYAPGARVWVEVRYGRRTLAVSVTDDGPRTSPAEPGGGHGLVGMRERVAMLGGTLSAGPAEPRGWTVVAELPYGDG